MQTFEPGDFAAAAEYFDRWGYVVFREAIPRAQGEAFWTAVEGAIASNPQLTYFMYGQFYKGRDVPLDGKKLPRIIDVESHLPEARPLMLSPVVTGFLKRWYGGRAPTCLQTLTYKYSSEQGAHSDKLLVSPPPASDYDRGSLTAAWFALEPANAENGALVIYPGSHRIEKPDIQRELETDYGAAARKLDEACRAQGCAPEMFEAQTGDILFWHGDLVHAGGPITSQAAEPPTRRSLVCHYADFPFWRRSRDPGFQRVRWGRGSFFHRRETLGFDVRFGPQRFLSGPRLG